MSTKQQRLALRGGYTIVIVLDPRFNRRDDVLDAAEDQDIRYHEPRDRSKPTLIFLTEKSEGNFPFALPRGVTYNAMLVPQIQAQRELWQWSDGTMSRVTVADDNGDPAHTLPDHLIREDARQAGVIARCVSRTGSLVVITSRAHLTPDGMLLSQNKIVRFSQAAGQRFITVSREEIDEESSDYVLYLKALRRNLDELRQALKAKQSRAEQEEAVKDVPADTGTALTTTQPIALAEVAAADTAPPSQTTPEQPAPEVNSGNTEPTTSPAEPPVRRRPNHLNNGGRKSFAARFPNHKGDA